MSSTTPRAAPGDVPSGRRSRWSTAARGARISTPYLLLVPAALDVRALHRLPDLPPVRHQLLQLAHLPGRGEPVRRLHELLAPSSTIPRSAPRRSTRCCTSSSPCPVQMVLGLVAAAMLTDRLPGTGLLARPDLHPGRHLLGDRQLRLRLHLQRPGRGRERRALVLRRATRCSIDWLAETWTGNAVIWIVGIWKGVGWSFIMFLAALDGVPRELVEASRVDGASEPRVWRHVVIPSIRPTIVFVLVLLVIGGDPGLHSGLPDDPGWPLRLDPRAPHLRLPAGVHRSSRSATRRRSRR